MAIGWITILQSVPWSEIIRNAPKVASAAKKLWNAVAKKTSIPDVSGSDAQTTTPPESLTVAAIEARVIALEANMSELNNQMIASSELIKALAEQNEQLIRRIETNRIHMIWLNAATIVVAIIALVSLFLLLFRHFV